MKTLILISSSSPLPRLPWAVVDEVSLVPGSCWRTVRWGSEGMGNWHWETGAAPGCAAQPWQAALRSPPTEGAHGLCFEDVLKLMLGKLSWMNPQSGTLRMQLMLTDHMEYLECFI